jgi:hypothetical protein
LSGGSLRFALTFNLIFFSIGYSIGMRSALNPLPFFFSIINTMMLNDIENKIVRRLAFAAATLLQYLVKLRFAI